MCVFVRELGSCNFANRLFLSFVAEHKHLPPTTALPPLSHNLHVVPPTRCVHATPAHHRPCTGSSSSNQHRHTTNTNTSASSGRRQQQHHHLLNNQRPPCSCSHPMGAAGWL